MARPYLHTKEYHVVRGGSMLAVAQELWSHVEAAKFLEGEGGTALLLLPALSDERVDGLAARRRAPRSPREMPRVAAGVRARRAVNAVERTPLPLFHRSSATTRSSSCRAAASATPPPSSADKIRVRCAEA